MAKLLHMTLDPNQLASAIASLGRLVSPTAQPQQSEPSRVVAQPVNRNYPPNMFELWEYVHDGGVKAERLVTDGITTIAYEVATTKAALGEWQWQSTTLPFSEPTLAGLANIAAIGWRLQNSPPDDTEARLLLLRAAVTKVVDDPNTHNTTRAALIAALAEIGIELKPY